MDEIIILLLWVIVLSLVLSIGAWVADRWFR